MEYDDSRKILSLSKQKYKKGETSMTNLIVIEHSHQELLNEFLDGLSTDERRVFLCRYWYLDPVKDIAKRFSFGESKVKMMLKRTREKLLIHLEKEGITLWNPNNYRMH